VYTGFIRSASRECARSSEGLTIGQGLLATALAEALSHHLVFIYSWAFMSHILDTNIFNWLREGRLQIGDLPASRPYIATNIQISELNKTKNEAIRNQLLEIFTAIAPKIHPTETFVADVSSVDLDKVGGGKLYEKLRAALNILNGSKQNNVQDALIGEVALLQGLTLITADGDFAKVVQEHDGSVIYFSPSRTLCT
jgi:hypothetical protein